jgi:hypothetical protein
MNERSDAMPTADDNEIERVCSVLENLARKCAPGSEEEKAIRDAALAYQVVWQHDILKRNYLRLRDSFEGPLTDEMKADLRRHGIEPDELEDAEVDGPSS